MWLVTTRGFYSVVEHRDDEDKLLVRGRVKADLERLEDLLPGIRRRIIKDVQADYAWRAVVDRTEWQEVVYRLTLELDYPNFKDAVAARQGYRRASIYMRVWSALWDLTPRRRPLPLYELLPRFVTDHAGSRTTERRV